MTSVSLLEMVRRGAERVLGRSFGGVTDKRTMLRALEQHGGPEAVVASGREIRDLTERPVLDAICASSQPLEVLDRWMRLERFGHTRNRTRLRDVDASRRWAEVVHFAQSAGEASGDESELRPEPIDDLFVWGLLLGLLERAGVTGMRVEIGDEATGRHPLADVDLSSGPNPSVARFHWASASSSGEDRAASEASESTAEESEALARRLATLVRGDPLHTWTVAESARRLAVSTRQLQRRLRAEGTSFRMVLQRARIDVSRGNHKRGSVSLVEIAFCAGFSDAAHFSRVFRRHLEVPPSAYRDVLRAGSRA